MFKKILAAVVPWLWHSAKCTAAPHLKLATSRPRTPQGASRHYFKKLLKSAPRKGV